MPTKKERITELERKVAELEERLNSGFLIPYNPPNIIGSDLFPSLGQTYCSWCHKYYSSNTMHYCPNYPTHWVDPNRIFTITTTIKTTTGPITNDYS